LEHLSGNASDIPLIDDENNPGSFITSKNQIFSDENLGNNIKKMIL